MSMVFDRIIKYVLWFVFCVIFGSFLFGFIKFGFNLPTYIEYLNNIQLTQLFSGNTDATSTGTLVSGGVVDLTGRDLYDSDMNADVFGYTGSQVSGSDFSGSIDDESYGFVKSLANTGEDTSIITEAHVISSGSVDLLTGNSKEQLKNLLLRE